MTICTSNSVSPYILLVVVMFNLQSVRSNLHETNQLSSSDEVFEKRLNEHVLNSHGFTPSPLHQHSQDFQFVHEGAMKMIWIFGGIGMIIFFIIITCCCCFFFPGCYLADSRSENRMRGGVLYATYPTPNYIGPVPTALGYGGYPIINQPCYPSGYAPKNNVQQPGYPSGPTPHNNVQQPAYPSGPAPNNGVQQPGIYFKPKGNSAAAPSESNMIGDDTNKGQLLYSRHYIGANPGSVTWFDS